MELSRYGLEQAKRGTTYDCLQSTNHLEEQCYRGWIQLPSQFTPAPALSSPWDSHSDFSEKPPSLVSASHWVTLVVTWTKKSSSLGLHFLIFTMKGSGSGFQTYQAMGPLQNQHIRQRKCTTHLLLTHHSFSSSAQTALEGP